MTEHRLSILPNYGVLRTDGVEASWMQNDLNTERPVVGGKRILIVDDEEQLRACLRTMLELEGHQVTEASNGAQAWNLFSIGEFDLVITDFQMPVMEGNKLAIGIKLLAPSVPILMITACERARRDARNPVDALLNKPFTVSELRSELEKLFSIQSEAIGQSLVATPPSPSVTFAPEAQLVPQPA